MAVIRHQAAQAYIKEAVVLNLGDLAQQAQRMKVAAQAEADRIIAAAKTERERMLAGAREEGMARGTQEGRTAGHAQGRKEGHAAALAESRTTLTTLEGAWTASLDAFRTLRAELQQDGAQEVVRLALEIASRVVKRAIVADPTVVQDQVGAALRLAMTGGRLIVKVHPDDEPLVREALPRLAECFGDSANVVLERDAAIERGSCRVRGAGGSWIDATVKTQLDRIAAAILPLGADGGASPESGGGGVA